MKFFMPTEVFIGENVILKNKERFENLGEKALIVTGKNSSKQNGSLKEIEDVLNENNIKYIIFDKVEENPSVQTVVKAGDLGRNEKVDFIIGIGGGSPIDAAKAIGVYILNTDLTEETLFTTRKLKGLDVIAVATTAGTGTETTQYSILTDNENKTKRNLGQEIFPKLAFVDPRFMMGMNIQTTRNTAIDALSHIVEGYLNTNANKITDGLVKVALGIFSKSIDGLKKGALTIEDRENLAIASNIGGMIIAQTGTSLPHGLGYALTYNKKLPHGLANGCLYREYLKVFKKREKVDALHEMMGMGSLDELCDFIEEMMNIELEITKEEIEEYTSSFMGNKDKLKNHPEEISYEEVYNLYFKSLMK
ncbi:MAG: iron-containing alcohol dehydrogenase family protein [Clostridium sp.]|uniref:iron-containing alcohol dehydrogenase family protein n=1 Tax=Clostridium sp. TaxID=1506 RepID=UPI003F3A96BF